VERAARRRFLAPSVITAGLLLGAALLTEVALRTPAPADRTPHFHGDGASALASEAPQVSPEDAERFNRRGVELARAGDVDGAILQFTQAIAADPMNYKSHNNLGVLYKRKGFIRHAIDAYKTASRIEPENAVPHKNLAILYEETDGTAQALEHYARLRGEDPPGARIAQPAAFGTTSPGGGR
jgi:Flp pilus assembly protein TadD